MFKYEIETGNLIRILKTSNSVNVGDIAGSINNCGYIRVNIKGKLYQAHRLIWLYMYGELPSQFIDHIDRDRINNRIENLREANVQENNRNRKMQNNNTTGYVGVSKHNPTGKYRARCKINGVEYHLGLYTTPYDAFLVREKFAKEHFGDFYAKLI